MKYEDVSPMLLCVIYSATLYTLTIYEDLMD